MSRIGKKAIPIPSKAKVELESNSNTVKVHGPLGSLECAVPHGISVEVDNNCVFLKRKDESKRNKSLHGLNRTIIANMLEGVTKGFQRELKIVGVGYRVELKGKRIVFSLGYSHPIVVAVPKGITIEVKNPDNFFVKGYDKELVGNVAAKIRSLRPPEPYKGKGIQYVGEYIRRKAGKAAV